MKIIELMCSGPRACTPKEDCTAALEIMRQKNCGCVPVVESHKTKRLVGIVTDRDIALKLLEEDAPPSRVSLEACMRPQPRVIAPESDLDEAVRLMETAAVHRLPVVSNGMLVGILSLKDIAVAAARRHSGADEGACSPEDRQIAELIESIALSR
ncbi:MAG: hypothetical protein COV76_03795 [Candidatus Omnitrophica bacterium CG11_big_fil_rev_8_21_14_0_20_64_10]|nr:MAG: hypothetical protein COV76_03795 [Candidatus Omnitrophica bacterium CG11_big_fil_rev_8_21_14_0_20_64_10]